MSPFFASEAFPEHRSTRWMAIPVVLAIGFVLWGCALLIYQSLVANSFPDFFRFLDIDGSTASGLLVDVLWWQALFEVMLSSLVKAGGDLVASLIVILLIRDSLPLKGMRLTLVSTVWLISPTESATGFSSMLELFSLTLDEQWLHVFANSWRNGSFIAIALCFLWPASLQAMKNTYRVYPLPVFDICRVASYSLFRLFLVVFLFRFICYFDPLSRWLVLHQTDVGFIRLYQPAATTFSLAVCAVLMLFLLANIRKLK